MEEIPFLTELNIMNKKKLIILALVAVILLVVLIVGLEKNQAIFNKKVAVVSNAGNNNAKDIYQVNPTNFASGTAPIGSVSPTASTTVFSTSTKPLTPPPATPAIPLATSVPTTFTGNLNAMPGSPEAPTQVLIDPKKVPSSAVKISVSDKGFSPKEFTVQAGKPVILALTGTDTNTHVLIFPASSLMSLMLVVSNGATRVVTFTAPVAGTYAFRDDIPSNRANTGNMIVK